MSDEDPWDRHATWWRETFTNGADLEYELQILPLAVSHLVGSRRVLDLGSGEGHLARRLVYQAGTPLVVGLEPSTGQLGSAVSQASVSNGLSRIPGENKPPQYVRGVGERLPFRDGSFDGVVCCLVIEHTVDPDAVLAEAVRVLAVGGRFILLVNHPLFQGTGSGFVDDQILGEHDWRVGPYLREDVALEEVDPGVQLRFAHRPLSRYVNPVVALGCVLTPCLRSPNRPLSS